MQNTIFFDSSNATTDLCRLAAKYNTDKSPFSEASPCSGHRKGYTAFYEMILAPLRNKQIDLCEIGIEQGGSLMTFSDYFPYARLFGMELLDHKIEHCRSLSIPRSTILKTDVSDRTSLNAAFNETARMFDVIIDDSTHEKEHQINIIEVASRYLKPGGILIIEDLYRMDTEDVFDSVDKSQFSHHTFVTCHHDSRHCWDNDKIWYAVKR